MPDIRKLSRIAVGAIHMCSFTRTRNLELGLSAAHRELFSLQHNFLELGLLASTYARQRDNALNQIRKTEKYIHFVESHRGVTDGARYQSAGTLGVTEDTLNLHRREAQIASDAPGSITGSNRQHIHRIRIPGTWSSVFPNAIRQYLTPYVRSLENELTWLHQETEILGNKYLALADRANTLACLRDSAVRELKNAREYADSLAAARTVRATSPKTCTPEQPSASSLGSVTEKLHQTQLEKNDIAIKLAEDEDYIRKLEAQRARLEEETSALKQQVAGAEHSCDVGLREKQSLADDLGRVQTDYANTRRRNQQRIEALQKCVIDRELQLTAAHKQIEDLALQSTEALRRQEAADKKLMALDQELGEEHRKHTESLHAVSHKLHQRQLEKHDIEITLAESRDRIESLEGQQAQYLDEIIALKKQLTVAANHHAVDREQLQSLTAKLDRARKESLNASNSSEQQINALKKHSMEVEYQLSASRRRLENLEQQLAESAWRQQASDNHIKTLKRQLDETQRKYSENAPGEGDVCSDENIKGRHARSFSWAKTAAGFAVLLGLLASVNRMWEIDYSGLRLTGANKDLEPEIEQISWVDNTRENRTTMPADKSAEFAQLEVKNPQAGDAPDDRPDKRISPLSRLAIDALVNDTQTLDAKLPRVYAWLMGDGSSMTWAGQPCRERGLSERECEHLRKNMFEERVIRLPDGVQYTVLRNGTGSSPNVRDTVLVAYRGMLLNGQEFDSSVRRGGPVSLRLDEVIKGLQDVLQRMEEGAKWRVYVPGDLAFKEPAEHAGQTLIFEIELLSVN